MVFLFVHQLDWEKCLKLATLHMNSNMIALGKLEVRRHHPSSKTQILNVRGQ